MATKPNGLPQHDTRHRICGCRRALHRHWREQNHV